MPVIQLTTAQLVVACFILAASSMTLGFIFGAIVTAGVIYRLGTWWAQRETSQKEG